MYNPRPHVRSALIFSGIGALALLAIFLVSAGRAAQSHKGPAIAWTPLSLEQTVLAGKTVTVPISFTTSSDLNNISLSVVPELSSIVTVSPSSVAHLSAGQTQQVQVTFAPSATMTPQTLNGTLHVQASSQTIAKPLPVTLTVNWETVPLSEGGASVSVPPVYQRIDNGQPIADALAAGGGGTLALYRLDLPDQPSSTAQTDKPVDGCSVEFGAEDNSAHLSISDWVNTHAYVRPSDVLESTTVNGKPAIKQSGTGDVFGEPFVMVYVDDGPVVLTVSGDAHGDQTIKDRCSTDLQNILELSSL